MAAEEFGRDRRRRFLLRARRRRKGDRTQRLAPGVILLLSALSRSAAYWFFAPVGEAEVPLETAWRARRELRTAAGGCAEGSAKSGGGRENKERRETLVRERVAAGRRRAGEKSAIDEHETVTGKAWRCQKQRKTGRPPRGWRRCTPRMSSECIVSRSCLAPSITATIGLCAPSPTQGRRRGGETRGCSDTPEWSVRI